MSLLDLVPPGVIVPRHVEALLVAMVPNQAATATVSGSPAVPGLMGGQLQDGASVPFRMDGAALVLDLTGVTLRFADVTPATRTEAGQGSLARVRYAKAPGSLTAGVVGGLRIEAGADNTATVHVEPGLAVTPSGAAVLLPSGFGLRLPPVIAADGAGLALSDLEIALPAEIPLFGGFAVTLSRTVGPGRWDAEVPVGASGSLRWAAPVVGGLADLTPTGVELTLDLPAETTPLPHVPVANGPAVGQRVRFRLGMSRQPDDPTRISTTLTAEAPDGLVTGWGREHGDIAAGITAAFAPAVAAATGAPAKAGVAALFANAATLGSRLADAGGYTLHAVTLDAGVRESETATGGTVRATVDISGAVVVKELGAAPVTISMDPNRPLRVRWRNVRATIAGADVALDFSAARPDVVDPGGWTVSSPGSLLDIVGTRSGAGSTWFEIDLRFMLDLGPVKVHGATVRATFGADGSHEVGLRGLAAEIDVPGLLSGSGTAALTGTGIDLLVGARIVPVNVGAMAALSMADEGGVRRVQLAFGVDLPGPIPLGPTGLGLYGVLGAFGANAAIPPLGADPLRELLKWKPWDALDTRRGAMTVGAGVVLGTAVDGGFLFSSLGVFGVTAPDLALRIGLHGKVLAKRFAFAEFKNLKDYAGQQGLTFFGGLSATTSSVDIAMTAAYNIPYIVSVTLPVAARYPFGNPQGWWLHAGSDEGVDGFRPDPARPPGPLRAEVLPGTPFSTNGWAFLMVHGDRITNLLGSGRDFEGFAVAVGAGFTKTLGIRGVVWADIHARLAAALSAKPVMLWAKATVGGELGIGPFSIGIDATLELQVGPRDRVGYRLEVCGEVDLWLDTLRECIRIDNLGDQGTIPDPSDEDWPFPTVALADGLGRSLTEPGKPSSTDRPLPGGDSLPADSWPTTPTVWPDTVPLLTFPIAPFCDPGAPQAATTPNTGIVSSGQISYRWRLVAVRLDEVTENGSHVPQPITPTAWQQPAGVPQGNGQISTQRQLALLTGHHGISAVHLADGGDGLPLRWRPADYVAGLCAWRPAVGRGWSLGMHAERTATGWHAPRECDLFGVPPLLPTLANGTGFTVTSTRGSTRYSPGLAHVAGPTPFVAVVQAADRTFAGGLRLTSASWVPNVDSGGQVTHDITFDDLVDEGDLYLRLDPAHAIDHPVQSLPAVVTGADGFSHNVTAERVDERHGLFRVPVKTGNLEPAVRLTLELPWWLSPVVLGLHALAAGDKTTGWEATAATKDAATTQHNGDRTVLKAGARYRLSVELSWSRLASPDGTVDAADAPESRTRYWYFRTASGTNPAVDAGWKAGGAMRLLKEIYLGTDRFKPHYLGRYLSGYTPADHSELVFTSDRPRADFRASHVDKLAAAFGREVGLLLRRTDIAAPTPKYANTGYALNYDTPWRPLDVLVAESAARSGCPAPPTGACLTWPAGLEPNAPYELSVAVPPAGEEPTPGSPELDGVTFTTSAYSGPPALIAAFGFTSGAGPGKPSGDLPVQLPSRPPGLVVDDAELELVLRDLGLPPPRPVDIPRSSVLWARGADGAWAIVGLLFESTEPMHRADGKRMKLLDATVAGVELPVRRRNRSGTRAAWLATSPVPVSTTTTLAVGFTDKQSPQYGYATVEPPPGFLRGAVMGGRTP